MGRSSGTDATGGFRASAASCVDPHVDRRVGGGRDRATRSMSTPLARMPKGPMSSPDQRCFKAALNASIAADRILDNPEVSIGVIRALEMACTHTDVRQAGPRILDHPHELLIPLPGTGVGVLTKCRVCARAHLYKDMRHIMVSLRGLDARGDRLPQGDRVSMHNHGYSPRGILLPSGWVNRNDRGSKYRSLRLVTYR